MQGNGRPNESNKSLQSKYLSLGALHTFSQRLKYIKTPVFSMRALGSGLMSFGNHEKPSGLRIGASGTLKCGEPI